MALNELYNLFIPLGYSFFDKTTGLALANGKLSFYRDNDRNTPKDVYELTGVPATYSYTSLGSELTLNGSGQIVNGSNQLVAVYLYPYDAAGDIDLYYLAVENSAMVAQWTRQALPNLTAANNPSDSPFPIDNQIANAQFSRTFLNSGVNNVISITGNNVVVPIAPDWDLIASSASTGTVTIRVYPIAGNAATITNPSYELEITVDANISQCLLRQKLNRNSGVWTSTSTKQIFLAGGFLARNLGVGSISMEMFYVDSPASSPTTTRIVNATVTTSYKYISGVTTAALPTSTNSATSDEANGYADILISFPTSSQVRFSSVQVIPTLNQAGANFLDYDRNTSNREQALMGDYYIPQLEKKRQKSYLVGWDFKLNPFQFKDIASTFTLTNANTVVNSYIADQTIARSNGATGFTVGRNSDTGGMQFTSLAGSEAFYISQYLEGNQVKEILENRLSVNVLAHKTAVGTSTVKVYLFQAGTGDSFPIVGTNVLGAVGTDGTFSLDGYATGQNWTEIARSGLPTASATVQTMAAATQLDDIQSGLYDYQFNQWEEVDNTKLAAAGKFAIVVTFTAPTISTVITVESISLNPGDIATRPAPQTPDEVLRECQRFYEKSIESNVTFPETGTKNYTTLVTHGTREALGFCNNEFRIEKRAVPELSFYSVHTPALNNFSVLGSTTGASISSPNAVPPTGNTLMPDDITRTVTKKLIYEIKSSSGAPFGGSGELITIQWLADARLGVVT